MNNTQHEVSVSKAFADMVAAQMSPDTRRLKALGQERGWDFSVLGNAPMPKEHTWLGEWLLVPADQDTTEIPEWARERVVAIYADGLWPQGFVVVHDAPKLLPPPVPSEPGPLRLPVLPEHVRSTLKTVGTALGGVAVVAGMVAGVAALAVLALLAAAVLIVPLAAVAAISVDPILIAVTEDGYWVEIARWDAV